MRLSLIIPSILILLISGCSSSKVHYDFQAVYVDQDIADKTEYMKKNIIHACVDRGWIPSKVEKNKITADLTARRRHKITVLIEYTDSGFSISPVSTTMNKPFGRVHRKHNQWISNLHRQIEKQIAKGQFSN